MTLKNIIILSLGALLSLCLFYFGVHEVYAFLTSSRLILIIGLFVVTSCVLILWKLINPYTTISRRYVRIVQGIKIFGPLHLKLWPTRCALKYLNSISLEPGWKWKIKDIDIEALGDTTRFYLINESDPNKEVYDLFKGIRVENSAIGALQVYLLMMSEHYLPLWDHACYMERRFVSSKCQMLFGKYRYVGDDDLKPHVEFTKLSPESSEATISACYWSEWGGLDRETYYLKIVEGKIASYKLISTKTLLEYNCGIMF